MRFFLSLTSSTICIRLELAFAASAINLSLSFSNFWVSLERTCRDSLFCLFYSLRVVITFSDCFKSSLFLVLTFSTILIEFFIYSRSRTSPIILLCSVSVCFRKYSISLVRAETAFLATVFSLTAFSLASVKSFFSTSRALFSRSYRLHSFSSYLSFEAYCSIWIWLSSSASNKFYLSFSRLLIRDWAEIFSDSASRFFWASSSFKFFICSIVFWCLLTSSVSRFYST